MDQFRDISCYLKESANINTLWASLMIEECHRLGLTVSLSDKVILFASSLLFITRIQLFIRMSVHFINLKVSLGCVMCRLDATRLEYLTCAFMFVYIELHTYEL